MTRACLVAFIVLSQLPGFARANSELEIRKVLDKGIEAWALAQRTLDPTPLRTWFRDQALVDLEQDLASSRESRAFASFDAPRITYEKISVDSERGQAIVETLETWQYSAHQLGSGECLYRAGPNTVRATYRLRREDEGWRVVSTSSETQGERAPTRPCEISEQHPR